MPNSLCGRRKRSQSSNRRNCHCRDNGRLPKSLPSLNSPFPSLRAIYHMLSKGTMSNASPSWTIMLHDNHPLVANTHSLIKTTRCPEVHSTETVTTLSKPLILDHLFLTNKHHEHQSYTCHAHLGSTLNLFP